VAVEADNARIVHAFDDWDGLVMKIWWYQARAFVQLY
jgi:hypothetical protein